MFEKIVVPVTGHSSLRLSLGSGSIRATAEDRDDFLIDGKSPHIVGAEVDDDGVVSVAVAGGNGSVDLVVPLGSDLILGTQSGRVTLKGEFGAVQITTESGSISVDHCDRADLRTGTGTGSGRQRVSAPEVISGAVLFTDIVGFTEFNALQGDDEAVRLIALQEQCVIEELPDGARVIKEIGDGMLLWFPSACAAVQTAIRLQQRYEAISDDPGTTLSERMGIHWGKQTVRRDDIVGHDVNVASRVMDTAGPGEIVVSEQTKRVAAPDLPDVRFIELGPVRMKGIPEPIRLFRVATESW